MDPEEQAIAIFVELEAAIELEDYPRAVLLADQALALNKLDKDAFKCKILSLINQNMFQQSIDAIRASALAKFQAVLSQLRS